MNSPNYLPRYLAVTVAAALAVIAGCGSGATSRSPIKGSVRYDGQPVDQGGIAFIPEGADTGEKRFRATGEIKDGQYELDSRHGPNTGKYRVEITWHKKTGKQVAGERGHKRDQTQQVIPAKYNTQSELVIEIERGHNTRDFDLKK
jgi:hypothetical protein